MVDFKIQDFNREIPQSLLFSLKLILRIWSGLNLIFTASFFVIKILILFSLLKDCILLCEEQGLSYLADPHLILKE